MSRCCQWQNQITARHSGPEKFDMIDENFFYQHEVQTELKSLLDAMSSLPKPAMAVQVLLLHVTIGRWQSLCVKHENVPKVKVYFVLIFEQEELCAAASLASLTWQQTHGVNSNQLTHKPNNQFTNQTINKAINETN